MAKQSQERHASETEISVDMNAADPAKAVTRRESGDLAREVRDADDSDAPRTKAERDLFKRMGRLERNLTKQFDQQRAADQAEHQRQISELQSKLDRVSLERGGGSDAADAAHEAAVAVLKDKLAAAYEKGDSAASADITLQISKLDAQFWGKKANAAGVVQREAGAGTEGRPAARADNGAAAAQNKGPTVAGSRFIRANDEWWDDPEFEVEKAAGNVIYLNLVNKEGFDPKDDETFREVAKQLKAKFPRLPVHPGRREAQEEDGGDGEDDGQRRQERALRQQAPAARLEDRGSGGTRNRGDNRTLTALDMKTMRDCRLDPDNDDVVVAYLREAVALEAQS